VTPKAFLYTVIPLLGSFGLAQAPNQKPPFVDSIPADSVCTHRRGFVGPCVTVHGRVQTNSDNVLVSLSMLRGGRVLEIQNEISGLWFPVLCALPQDIYTLLAEAKIIYADFVIRRLTPDHPGVMGYACIASATHVVTRPGGLEHPLFSLPHLWCGCLTSA